jgi:tetratricopeptide (TPR) repeat protein
MAKQGIDNLLRTALRLRAEAKPVEAERMFRAVLQSVGDESRALVGLAAIEMDRNKNDDALDYAIRAVNADGENPGAYHALGDAYMRLGHPDQAAGAYGRAVELAPGHLGVLAQFARALSEAAAPDAAAQAYRKLVSLSPRDPAVAFEAAVALQSAGASPEALYLYCRCACVDPASLETIANMAICDVPSPLSLRFNERAHRLSPENMMIASNLGNALSNGGRRDEAIVVLTSVLERAPYEPLTHFNLGAAYGPQDPSKAMAHYSIALVLAPHFASAWVNVGGQLVRDCYFYHAANAYLRAMWLEPYTDRGRMNAALAFMYAGESDAPAALMADSLALRRGTAFWPVDAQRVPPVPDHVSFQVANSLKLRHDAEQLRYLQSLGYYADELAPAIVAYDEIRGEIEAAHGAATVSLPPQVRERVGGVYNRVVRWRPTPRLSDPVISDSFDRAEVTARYAEPPGITWVDNLLTAQALAELRAFCLESTIWFDMGHNFADTGRGYLGTTVTDGFCCPLLFQIAEEMRRSLPDIFRDYPLMQMWAYKGDAQLQALEAHADAAAVNVNFWITPDDANLDPDSGGLTVWTAEAPADWDFDKFNNDRAALMTLCEAPGVRRIDIAHRQNRALIFNSDLIHGSQPVNFAPGYENRRINVTMLFGTRDRDWQRLSR